MEHLISRPTWQGVLAVSLMLFVFPASYADSDKPTDEQCLDAYLKSPAAASCSQGIAQFFRPHAAVHPKNNKCLISDSCPGPINQAQPNRVEVTLEQASHLNNCDGILKLSC